MPAIGIDLGTTNSLIAVYEETGPRLIRNALGKVLTPSAVSMGENREVLVGEAARDRLITHPARSAAGFKRLMGTAEMTSLAGKPFRPEELSGLVLAALKRDAEAELGTPVTEAVISVPAYFNDPQRKATIDAASLAGLKVERLVNEPTAAALAYGLGDTPEGQYLVFDLGGGTFDVSILDKYDDVMEIRATTGDTRLGGGDFTAVIERWLTRRHALAKLSLAPGDEALLRHQAERLKFALTSAQEAAYDFALGDTRVEGRLDRTGFETECAALLQRLRLPAERAVRDGRLQPDDLNAIVMVGGATRMPMVRSLVARLFGKLPLITIDPDTTVALGAAVQAGLIRRSGALRDVVMTDVSPHTLGIALLDTSSGDDRLAVEPLIERNAIVPISRNITVATVRDKQKAIAVQVYQGENLRPDKNVHLGTIEVPVPPRNKGEETIDVRFTYDVNGALQVEVTVHSTGRKAEKIFENGAGLSREELQRRFGELSGIKALPRDMEENRALIARAERLYEELRGADREALRAMLGQFEQTISDQQLRKADELRSEFARGLDALDPFRGPWLR